jgi:hypothetical protein
MKKVRILIVVLAILLIAIPVSAAKLERVGERINIFSAEPDEYEAREPFHIVHGWGQQPLKDAPPGQFDVELFVDGEFVDEDYVEREVTKTLEGPELRIVWVHNFLDGKEVGDHDFEVHWYLPCGYAVDSGLWGGDCETPNVPVDVYQATHTVLFYEP